MTHRQREAWLKFLATRFGGFVTDAAVIALACVAAVALRFDFREPISIGGWSAVASFYVNVSIVYLLSLIVTGCYRLPWRRTTTADLPRYLLATVLATAILTAMRYYLPQVTLSHVRPPYSITAICFFLVTAGVFGVRLVWHAWWLARVREDNLLERRVKHFDSALARRLLKDKVVMVTGAGGSIGSEIVCQVAAAGAKMVLMVERGENALYEIDRRMNWAVKGQSLMTQCLPLMVDINEREKIAAVFERYRPEVVLHAAAYKHVPMVESNPDEGWRNNTEATRQLAELAKEYGVKRFVLISTDKAVNPVSVMGKTKKAAEEAIMSLSPCGTSFCAVRFGNVLGSSGSVVPLFREQIAARRPVTVTDPKMRRYFMTVAEAVSLVLQAASRDEEAIYTLDMGEPVKILDLAENLIEQAGFRPYVDIPIVFTGIRPGEKLFEEIDISEKNAYRTDMAKIYITKALIALFAFTVFADDSVDTVAAAESEEAAKEANDYSKYEPIITRAMFGQPPAGFDPDKSPDEVKADRGGRNENLTPEQQQLQKAVHFSVLNLDLDGNVYVGFTDKSDPKAPHHLYLRVGEESRGWKVLEADALAGTATLEKDGVELAMSLGDQNATASTGGAKGGSRTNERINSLSERRRARRDREQADRDELRKEFEEKSRQREEKEEAEKADREQQAEEMREQLQDLRVQLSQKMEAKSVKNTEEEADKEAPTPEAQ